MDRVLSFFRVKCPRACSSAVVDLDCVALISRSISSVDVSASSYSACMSFDSGHSSGWCGLDIALSVCVSRNGIVVSMSPSVGASVRCIFDFRVSSFTGFWLMFLTSLWCRLMSSSVMFVPFIAFNWFICSLSGNGGSSSSSAMMGVSSHFVVGANDPQSLAAFRTSLSESFFSGATMIEISLCTPSFCVVSRMCIASAEANTG